MAAASSKWYEAKTHPREHPGKSRSAARNEATPPEKTPDFAGTPLKTGDPGELLVKNEDFDPRRSLLLELFRAGLARVHGRNCVRAALAPSLRRGK